MQKVYVVIVEYENDPFEITEIHSVFLNKTDAEKYITELKEMDQGIIAVILERQLN
jgi:hypothetical protein